jgi:hypothetical protein
MRVTCPKCGEAFELNVGKLIRDIPSELRSETSRENGKKGGRPKKTKKEN